MFFFVGQETDSNVVSAKSNMRSRRVVFRRSMCFVFVVASFGYFGWKSTFRSKTVSNSVDILKVPIELDSPFEQGLERSPLVEENKSSLIAKKNLTVASFSYEHHRQHDNLASTHANKHHTTLITTSICLKDYFLLILVSSAPSNVGRRRGIRLTWGAENSTKPWWKTYFLVAQTRDRNLSESLLHEGDAFGDLIRADYFDDYWNQTLKIQMGFEWASRYCNFSFLLKVDDDVFVNMSALLSNLTNPSMPKYKLYMGLLWQKLPVRRYKGDKWEVTKEEYEPDFYPDYCPGFGFVLSFDVVHSFVNLYQVVKPFKIDDVYVGMLAERAGVRGTNNYGFRLYLPRPDVPCNFDNHSAIVWHGVTEECVFQLFHSPAHH